MQAHSLETINVLTYDVAHKKTYDTLCLLKARGYHNVSVYGMPLSYKKSYVPLIEHRPPAFDFPGAENLCPKQVCNNFSYSYRAITDYHHINNSGEIFLVCGAGLLSEEFVKQNRIINAHPGYIPLARGLDSLKWSVYYGLPIGVTTHFIGDVVDAGEIIERRTVPIKENDSFYALAQRSYETEIEMLVSAIEKVNDEHDYLLANENGLFKRMPKNIEMELPAKFEEYKKTCIGERE